MSAARSGPLVAKASWGNDSVALIAWLTEHAPPAAGELRAVIHNITGWHSEEWPARRARCRAWAESLGWTVIETEASLVQLSLKPAQSGFPGTARPWCTNALKIEPTRAALDALDPRREATVCLGVRREESPRRASFPEHQAADSTPEGRDIWAPMARMREAERDAILRRHGFEPLPYRSRECNPCIGSKKADYRALTPMRISEIASAEALVGRTFVPPSAAMGAVGIEEVVRWAHSDRGAYDPGQGSFCDGGWCGT